ARYLLARSPDIGSYSRFKNTVAAKRRRMRKKEPPEKLLSEEPACFVPSARFCGHGFSEKALAWINGERPDPVRCSLPYRWRCGIELGAVSCHSSRWQARGVQVFAQRHAQCCHIDPAPWLALTVRH